MTKAAIALLAFVMLAACDAGNYPIFVCKERATQSGECTKGEYICNSPMELRSNSKSKPRCFMPDAQSR